jgi:hypothetical protein
MKDGSWTRIVTVGKPENNPLWRPRAIDMAAAGVRGRLGPVIRACGAPLERGAFAILAEPASNGGRT